MPVLAVLNQKGGVGKTTVALNLAHQWATGGARVLIIDADKQGAATASLIATELADDAPTLTDALAADRDGARHLARAIQAADPQWGGVHVAPASLDLEDVWASNKPGVVFRLRRILDEAGVHTTYDWVIIDGPPDLGPGTVAAAVAADAVLIPTRPERMSLHGVARTVETVDVVRRDMRPDVAVVGIVAVAVDTRLTEHTARVAELASRYGDRLLPVTVPHRLRADEASGAGVPAGALEGPAGPAFADVYGRLCTLLDTRLDGSGRHPSHLEGGTHD